MFNNLNFILKNSVNKRCMLHSKRILEKKYRNLSNYYIILNQIEKEITKLLEDEANTSNIINKIDEEIIKLGKNEEGINHNNNNMVL